MLGGAGPLEVVQVVSGESLDLRQDDRVVRWRLGQVDAPEGDECHAAASKAWLEEYVRPVSHPYLAFRPTGVPAEAGSAVELVVADVARVVGDRGSVNVAAVRAGAARWAGLPSGTASADDAERAMAEDLSARLSAAEADARAGRRGLWGACPDAPAASPAPGDGGLPGSEAHGS
jgi:endonuclease YncB( thermonuclease family)